MTLINSLSGRFLALTVVFVMIAEILIFVPSVARFRMDYFQSRLDLSQLASLALLATPNDMVDPELEAELLTNAEVINIVLRRDEMRELVLNSPMTATVDQTYDLRTATPYRLIVDALWTFLETDARVIRIIGMPVKGGGVEIESTLFEAPLRYEMIKYGRNIFFLSLFISVVTATLLFGATHRLIVRPIKRVVKNMIAYRDNPEDPDRIIQPRARVAELMEAETALAELQSGLATSLRQKDRLAALGGAVARVSHDLRNILTTAQLLADRIETSADPAVARTAPKLVGSLTRAINLCETTLSYGKAEEPAPKLQEVSLAQVIAEVLESDALAAEGGNVTSSAAIADDLMVRADAEHLYRVFANLVRNARQAIEATGAAGSITLTASRVEGGTEVEVADTGPGLPKHALAHLFQPFQGAARQGGTGLGLAIASELVRGHGGRLELRSSTDTGTQFTVFLPEKPARDD